MEASLSCSNIANEPLIPLVPDFSPNESKVLKEICFFSPYKRSKPNPKTFTSFVHSKPPRKNSKHKTVPPRSACECPNIIVADDDPFQHLYYQGLLQRALKSEESPMDSQNLSMHICFSGEELIEKMDKGSKCGCDVTKIVIVDYQMGEKKLNGVETSVKVRKDGYKGHLLLRTSETKDSLKKNHQDFDILLKEKVINVLVDKSDMTFGERFIQRLVSEDMRTF